MIQKHYYYFGKDLSKKMNGDCLNENNWDVLRSDEIEGPFSIEKSEEKYVYNCKKSESYRKIAQIVVKELEIERRLNRKVVSCGVGKGVLEWHIKNECPNIYIECTDYTKEAIENLKRVFTNLDDAYTFDMLNGDYSCFGREDSTIIMCRVSTEFNREQWNAIFEKMYMSGIKFIVYVPTGLDTKKTMRRERLKHVYHILRRRKEVFCGWLYSEDEFLNLFKNNRYEIGHVVKLDNTAIYFLKRDC